eukprot:CAMPEP_0185598448 /NCGR_PEP_ID=MMETSP0434-20130131/82001_1 /TAXON_ID=626734 ORGANISM="Favella taraikaensis, Strain Fe Narragansett Bay" /NCGR_SAMPLE_ID=MMETSP0434 /ASSEMBLY_ACC=CAM_ASM_000379 /LENGTH=106 /DNA_ID=CAMNT_0028227431 /DNA_START=588 /DNA_END=908 /DNA_ORIENTATION=+
MDGVVLRCVRQATLKVPELAPVDSVEAHEGPQHEHLAPVCKLVQKGAIRAELGRGPQLEAKVAEHVLKRLFLDGPTLVLLCAKEADPLLRRLHHLEESSGPSKLQN